SRIEALNQLNAMFGAGRLTDRHFEGAAVRIDDFTPLTAYGGGIVTVTLTGRLVETLDGKVTMVDLTPPMKFYRGRANPTSQAGGRMVRDRLVRGWRLGQPWRPRARQAQYRARLMT